MKDSREIIQKQVAEKVEIERPFDAHLPMENGNRYPGYKENFGQEGFQVLDYWRAIRKRLWLVIGIVVLLTTLVAIYVARKPDIFMAHAQVQVNLEQANQDLVADDKRLPVANQDPAYFNTQLQLLNSDSLLRRVVSELNLDKNAEFKKLVEKGSGSPLASMLKAVGLAGDLPKQEEKAVDEITVSPGSTVVTPEEIDDAVRLAPYVQIVKLNTGVEPVRESRATSKETRLIDITYRNTNSELAALVVNGIAGTFTQINQEKRTGTSGKTNDYLDKRIAELQSEIKAGEIRLYNLKVNAGVIATTEDQTIVVDRLGILNKDLLQAENARKNAQTVYESVNNSPEVLRNLVEQEMAGTIVSRENEIRSLINSNRQRIADLKVNKARLLQEYVASAPEVVEIDTQIRIIQDEVDKILERNEKSLDVFRKKTANVILENLRRKYNEAQATEAKFQRDYNEQYQKAQGENAASVSIKLLEGELEVKKGFLENLTKNQRNNDVVAIGTDNNISITEIAIPPDKPIGPKRLMTVMATMFLSTLFGMGLALFLEYLDDTIRTTEEVETYLQLPALAAIPTIDSMPKRRLLLVGAGDKEETSNAASDLLIHTDTRSSLSEAFRQLRTSILLSSAGNPPKTLLITSSLPAEGKTTTAINTAISLAQTASKVLIIDADMRRPRLHSVFNIGNGQGLSTLLSSQFSDTDVSEIMQYDNESKLYLMSSGPVPPNPAELIGSDQMSKLLEFLQGEFSHIVIDSPPIASFTDGVLIASMVDGVILVVQSGKSSRQVVRRSKQLLQDVGSRIFGVVLNNVNLRSQDNSYYYQSYYHRDNYRLDDEE